MNATLRWGDLCGETDVFWSHQLSVNSSTPDVTRCFRDTALVCMSAAFLWLCAPLYALYLRQQPTRWRSSHKSKLNIAKMFACVALCGTSVIDLSLTVVDDVTLHTHHGALYTRAIVHASTWAMATAFITWEFQKGVHSSSVLWIFWLAQVTFDLVGIRSHVLHLFNDGKIEDERGFVLLCITLPLTCLQLVLASVVDRAALTGPARRTQTLMSLMDEPLEKTCVKPSPEIETHFLSRITFWWVIGTIIDGFRRTIRFDDVYALRREDTCETLMSRFPGCFYVPGDSNGRRSKWDTRLRLVKSLIRVTGLELCVGAVHRLVTVVLVFLTPPLLRLLISFVGTKDPHTWKGLLYAGLMFLVTALAAVFIHQWLYATYRCAIRVNILLNATVYRKALRLSISARSLASVGVITNLMSVDAQKVHDLTVFIHTIWDVPLLVSVCVVLLWQTVGPAALAGLAILLVLLPFNAVYVGGMIRKLQSRQMAVKDKRMHQLNDVISGIKVLKLYAWEPFFQERILATRAAEMKLLRRAAFLNAVASVTFSLSPYLVSLVTFATYVLWTPGSVLDASTAFVALSLINILNYPMALVPISVTSIVQGIVSLGRIAKFLDLDENKDNVNDDCVMSSLSPENQPTTNAIIVENGTFSWGADTPILNNINLRVNKGALVAVIGKVGAGKSCLLSALLGEMTRIKGHFSRKGSLAYVPQQAWLQSNSLRHNILFNRKYNEWRYADVVRACALLQDLDVLEDGDMTEIGDKGISLSGGQKLRVSLARAVYQDADIYLLDDPLSAVDVHVAGHVFKHVIGPEGLLRHKTRILVTHHVTYLPYADVIVVLEDGVISEIGTFTELIAKQGPLARLLAKYTEDHGDSFKLEPNVKPYVTTSSLQNNVKPSLPSFSLSHGAASHRSQPTTTRAETVEEGKVKWRVIWFYVKASGLSMSALTLLCHVFFIVAQVGTNIWLSKWTCGDNVTGVQHDVRDVRDERSNLNIYAALGAVQALAILIESLTVAHGCVCASRFLHDAMLRRCLRAPMSFFDTTPTGRILNRFSKDLELIDSKMPTQLRQWLFALAPLVSTFIVISYSTPTFMFVVIPVTIIYFIVQRLYISAVRQLKRLEAVHKSPLYSHFDESVSGILSIRAYGQVAFFVRQCDRLINESQRAWYLIIVVLRWLGVNMELLGSFIVFLACLFAVLQRHSLTAGLAGLSISYALQVTAYTNVTIRLACELETYMVSVERVQEYAEITTEAATHVPEKCPDDDWPQKGRIEFHKYSTRYRKGLGLVLRNISLTVNPGEKIGIVGRTCAGKSSLSLALFRLLEADSGYISIDGVRISDIGLHDLRSRLTIIPQDPTVFSGTVKENLDPSRGHSDTELWAVLEQVRLKAIISSLPAGLEHTLDNGSHMLSVGQRQLMCLARALLRRSKLLVLDEATASVDHETDDFLQTAIRREFSNCTVLTVAHRISTVIDYDRVLVLVDGEVREFDKPSILIADDSSLFHAMVREAGIACGST